jgi:vacuolar-type H+-ATPase subunit E/Vma4
MSLEKLKSEIIAQAEAQERETVEQAKQEAERVIAEARAQAKEKTGKAEENARGEARELAAEMKASAALSARRMESEAREDAVQRVLQQVRSELKHAASSQKKYERVFEALARQAIKALGEKDFVLKTNARDRKLGEKFGRVAEAIETDGGVVVAKSDGSIQVNNTFEALIEGNEEMLKQAAFDELFGSAKPKPKTPKTPTQAKPAKPAKLEKKAAAKATKAAKKAKKKKK